MSARSLQSLIGDTLDFDEGDCDSLYFGFRYSDRGLEENDVFLLFPNPAQDHVRVEPLGTEWPSPFELYNSDGRCLMNESVVAGETTVQLRPVSSGLYCYIVTTPLGVKQRGKLCIIR